jgi:hypothetical protein
MPYLDSFFGLAQRFFCASDIRFLASALMRRRLGGREASRVTDTADVLCEDRPPSRAAIALSIRSLSAFNSPIISAVSKVISFVLSNAIVARHLKVAVRRPFRSSKGGANASCWSYAPGLLPTSRSRS